MIAIPLYLWHLDALMTFIHCLAHQRHINCDLSVHELERKIEADLDKIDNGPFQKYYDKEHFYWLIFETDGSLYISNDPDILKMMAIKGRLITRSCEDFISFTFTQAQYWQNTEPRPKYIKVRHNEVVTSKEVLEDYKRLLQEEIDRHEEEEE